MSINRNLNYEQIINLLFGDLTVKHFFLAFVYLFCSTFLLADDGTWNGTGGDNNWNTSENWVGSVIPGSGDDATMDTASPATVNVDVVLGTLNLGSFTLNSNGTNSLSVNSINIANEKKAYITGNAPREDFLSFGADPVIIGPSNNNLNFADPGNLKLYYLNIPAENAKNITVNYINLNTKDSYLRIPTLTLNNAAYTLTDAPVSVLPTNIVMDSGVIQLPGGDFPSNISGTGSLTVRTNVTLTGNNIFTGTISFSSATQLTGTTNSIPSTANIPLGNGSRVIFDQSFDGSYSNIISGTGGQLQKSGTETVTLSGANTYTGTTTVSAGTLSVTGAIASGSTTSVASGATLTGSGSVGPVNNSGTVVSGLAAGDTLTVNGAFTQSTADATVTALVTPSAASLLSITGAATLDGTLELSLQPTIYPAGTSFNVINAAGGRTSQFTTFNDNSGGIWGLAYNGNLVNVSLLSSVAVTPFPLTSLPQDSRNVGNYFFGTSGVFNASPDLTNVANASLAITNEEDFTESLIRLSPITQDTNVNTTFQNDLQMAVAIDEQFRATTNKKRLKKKQDGQVGTLCYGIPKTGAFVQPIGIFYNQHLTSDTLASSRAVPFTAYTYGAGFGYEHVFDNQFVIEGGVGYTHSNLNWKNNFGNSKWSSLYLAPFFGWFNDTAFANVMVMGAFNFYNTDRRIQFAGVERVAKSRYNSYDVLIRSNGGARFYLTNCFLRGTLWLQPEGTFNYLTIFTEGYTEKGAAGVNLQVKSHTNFFIQPSFRLRLIEEFITPKFCYAPNIYVGWLANVPLGYARTSARFTEAPTNIFFNIQGDTQTTNQLVLGADFFAQRFNKFELTSNFEADILSQFEIYTVKVKLEWFF